MNIQTVNSLQFSGDKQIKSSKEIYTKAPVLKEDTVEITNGSNDGKFTFKEAAKNFGKGIISPLKVIIDHPVMALGTIAAAGAACSMVPVLTPVLTIGFGALSAVQLAKGCYNAAKEYNHGNYDNSEKSFEQIGQGIINSAFSIFGLKPGAKIAAEAKTMNNLKVTALDAEKRVAISENISKGNLFNALKENLFLISTKDGLKSSVYQFTPKMLKTRLSDLIKFLKREPVKKTIEKKEIVTRIEKFKKTPEGIRRAGLTDEQIETEVNSIFNKAFDELEIPQDIRPKLKIEKGAANKGGSYSQQQHTISYNPESYRNGIMEMEDVIMHEATHCKEALLRAGLPQAKVDKIIKDSLINRILNGESEKILVKGGILMPETMTPPKMSDKMKQAFVRFAEDNLYVKKSPLSKNLNDYKMWSCLKENKDAAFDPQKFAETKQKLKPILDKLQKMIDDNPDFVSQYKNADEALNELVKYSLSHNVRYNAFTNVSIPAVPQTSIPKLTDAAINKAEQSLIEHISCIEGNAGNAFNIFGNKKAFNQYQFCSEEVLAQQNGNKFLIKNLTEKLNKMRAEGTLTPEDEEVLTSILERAKRVIEYKTKGLEYYKKYTQSINNPSDKNLAAEVKALEKELAKLEKVISPTETETVTKFIEVTLPYLYSELMNGNVPRNISALLNEISADKKENLRSYISV